MRAQFAAMKSIDMPPTPVIFEIFHGLSGVLGLEQAVKVTDGVKVGLCTLLKCACSVFDRLSGAE